MLTFDTKCSLVDTMVFKSTFQQTVDSTHPLCKIPEPFIIHVFTYTFLHCVQMYYYNFYIYIYFFVGGGGENKIGRELGS